MAFSSMCNDIVVLVKSDGQKFEKIRASVQANKIYIFDEKLPIEENDKIYRELPNGLVETYLVVDRGFMKGVNGIQSHYQITVSKQTSLTKDKFEQVTNIYNLVGTHAKVNINSNDNSVNIHSLNEVIDQARKAVSEIPDEAIREAAVVTLNELSRTQPRTGEFLDNYQKLIAVVADHLAILGPVIPALTQLLK